MNRYRIFSLLILLSLLSFCALWPGKEAKKPNFIFILVDDLGWTDLACYGSSWTPGAAVRQGNWKLIEFYHHEKTELYDLSTDSGEQNDLSEKQPGKTSELKELLRRMQDETGALSPVKNPAFSNNNSMNK